MKTSSNHQPKEDELSKRVKRELIRNSLLQDDSIEVFSEGDMIILEGGVDSLDKKWLAEDIALDTFGVLRVQNDITVIGLGPEHTERTTEEIRYDIDTGLS
jgi:osmotically-inducible protein OsmY